MSVRIWLGLLVLAALALSDRSYAQSCDAYFKFDGSLDDAGRGGYHGRMIGKEGAPAKPRFVEGRSGQALELDGASVMRAYLDLHPDVCPRVTISAWVRVDPAVSGTRMLVSTGNPGSPGFHVSGGTLTVHGPANGLWEKDVFRPQAGWTFVAAVYDFEGGTYSINWRGRSRTGELGDRWREPEEALWVGAMTDRLAHPASGVAIDDLRIVGSALSADELRALMTEEKGAGQTAAVAASEWQGPACETHANCGEGHYCGFDNLCHPDRHAPKRDIEFGRVEVPLTPMALPGQEPEGRTLSEMQQQLAERNASRVGVVDYDSPTDLLEEMRAADAERRASAPAEPPPPPSQGESADPPRVIGWRLADDDVYQTPVSGKGGEIVRVVDMEDSVLSGLEIFEPNNVPCFIRLYAVGDRPGESLNECTTTIFPAMDTSVWNRAIIEPAAVTSARVCHSFQGNDRVKGISVSGFMIEDDGSMGFYQQAQGDGPNCSDWRNIVFCNDGYVASGIVAHFKDRDFSESLTGMQLICRKVQQIYE
jgi:hypothetical protein